MKVVPPGETFRGLSYADWVAIWSNWFSSRDVDAYDGENMVFLRGYANFRAVSDVKGAMRYQDPEGFFDRRGDKKLNILKGTSVFVPTAVSVNTIGGCSDNKVIENEKDLRKVVNDDIDDVSSIWVKVKINHCKKPIKLVADLRPYRVETPLFKLNIPKDSALNHLIDNPMKHGVYDAVAVGYFVLLPDLAPSTYRIDFGCHGPGDYSTRGVYDITVYHDTRKEPNDIS